MLSFRLLSLSFALGLILPLPAAGQLIFDWPIRSVTQPEALLTGGGAVFWNPGSLASSAGTHEEVWITHIDGPDATGVRGVALAGTVDLPGGLRGGVGYWHLGIPDIPVTTDSPAQDFGTLEVAEDVAVLGLATDLSGASGVGASVRAQRGSAGGESRVKLTGSLGVRFSAPLPLAPRFGLSLGGLGLNPALLAGVELGPPPLMSGRVPIHLGYGIQRERGAGVTAHRISLRGSWMEGVHVGMGLSHWGEGEGWTPLWTLGMELGRYAFSVLREELSNGFGAVHFFQAAIRFPGPESP